jgi:hypothetical protein
MTDSATRHLIYLCLLRDCLTLSDIHAKQLESRISREEAGELLIRSVPDRLLQIFTIEHLENLFDKHLQIPGFYYDPQFSMLQEIALMCGLHDFPQKYPGHWRMNLPNRGLLRPYRDERGRISGLFIFDSANDSRPRLFTSKKLCLGTEAIAPLQTEKRLLAA